MHEGLATPCVVRWRDKGRGRTVGADHDGEREGGKHAGVRHRGADRDGAAWQ